MKRGGQKIDPSLCRYLQNIEMEGRIKDYQEDSNSVLPTEMEVKGECVTPGGPKYGHGRNYQGLTSYLEIPEWSKSSSRDNCQFPLCR